MTNQTLASIQTRPSAEPVAAGDPVVIFHTNAGQMDEFLLRRLSHHTDRLPTILERTKPVKFEMSEPELQREILRHFMVAEGLMLELPETLQHPKFPTSPAESARMRLRMIRKCKSLRGRELLEAHRSALLFELLDELVLHERQPMREKMRLLHERHELIAFMRQERIFRSAHTDEVMQSTWLGASQMRHALKNRSFYLSRKAKRLPRR